MKSPAFSAKAEYACVAVLELAARHGAEQPVRLKEMADAHAIPQRFLVQILLQLKAAGLVVTARGAQGGYRLARAPARVSMADVLAAIDRTGFEPARGGPPASPGVEAIRGVWAAVHAAQQRLLTETSFADLLERARAGQALSYQI